jgi:hypothetical protein
MMSFPLNDSFAKLSHHKNACSHPTATRYLIEGRESGTETRLYRPSGELLI